MGICIKCHKECGITQYYDVSTVQFQIAPRQRWQDAKGLFVCDKCGGESRFRLYALESFTKFFDCFDDALQLMPHDLLVKYLRLVMTNGGSVFFFDVLMHLIHITPGGDLHIGDEDDNKVYLIIDRKHRSGENAAHYKELINSIIVNLPENED